MLRKLCGIAAVGLLASLLGGCFYSSFELWSLSSGEQLPFGQGKMVCITYDEENGKERSRPVLQFVEMTSNDRVQYAIVGEDGTAEAPTTFHKVKDDVYIAVQAVKNMEGEYIAVVRATDEAFIVYGNNAAQIEKLASVHHVTVAKYGEIEGGTEADHKAFIVAVANEIATDSSKTPVNSDCRLQPPPDHSQEEFHKQMEEIEKDL